MSRMAHDAIRGILELTDGDASGLGSARFARECREKSVRQALSQAYESVVASGFSADDAARALACVAVRRGAYAATASAALDWLCLRLDAADLPKMFLEDDTVFKEKVSSANQPKLDVRAPVNNVAVGDSPPLSAAVVAVDVGAPLLRLAEASERAARDEAAAAADRKAFALRYAQQLLEKEADGEAREALQRERAAAWAELPDEAKRAQLEADLVLRRAEYKALRAGARTKARDNKAKARGSDVDFGDADELGGAIAELARQLAELPPVVLIVPSFADKRAEAVRAEAAKEAAKEEAAKKEAAKEEAAAAAAIAAAAEDDDDDDDDDADGMDDDADTAGGRDDEDASAMFDAADTAARAAPPARAADTSNDVQEEFQSRITVKPISWSGVTPRQKLDQWCRERGNPVPQYEVASRTVMRCRVWVMNREKVQHRAARKAKGVKPPLGKKADLEVLADGAEPSLAAWAASRACDGGVSGAARDLAATKALYDLCAELPVYRLLPPPFRDWWCAQLDAARQVKELDTEASRAARLVQDDQRCDETVERLLLFAAAADDAAAEEEDDGVAAEAAARRRRAAAQEQRRTKAAAAAAEQAALDAAKQAAEPAEATDNWEDLLSDDDGGDKIPEVAGKDVAAEAGSDDDWETKFSDDDAAGEKAGSDDDAEGGLPVAPREMTEQEVDAMHRAQEEGKRRGDELKKWWLERKASPKYVKLCPERDALPAAKARDAFVALSGDYEDANHRDAVVVCGETGSGKTTQLPHFLLNAALCAGGRRADEVRIVVTQPRRVAATSVAARVAAEFGEDDVGGLVGVHIRHERRVTGRTKIVFCTAGVLLRCLRGFDDDEDADGDADDDDHQGRDFVRRATHIILDEVHERAADGDLLLAALRRAIAAQRRRLAPPLDTRKRPGRIVPLYSKPKRQLSLVLMSATLDAALFQKYLDAARAPGAVDRAAAAGKKGDDDPNSTPLLKISGRTHPVADYFLEDIIAATGYFVASEGAVDLSLEREQETDKANLAGRRGAAYNRAGGDGKGENVEAAAQAAYCMERYCDAEAMPNSGNQRLDYDLVVAALEAVASAGVFVDGAGGVPDGDDSSSILVFLPGVAEIRRVADRLASSRAFERFCVSTLHANAAKDEQRKAFDPPPPGMRKIVLATNVAESSVTLPDVSTVVDIGRVKEVQHHDKGAGASEQLFAACPTLATTWCSRASARQRAGRAGRVRPGICVRLYSREHYEERMAPHQQPELQRIPLEELLLSIKMACDDAGKKTQPPLTRDENPAKKKKPAAKTSSFFGCAVEWLGECPQPPPRHALCAALSELVSVGALGNDSADDDDWEGVELAIASASDERLTLTPLGRHLARLPVHPRLGKMLVYGTLFGCVGPVASVAAAVGTSGRSDALFAQDPTRAQTQARTAEIAPPRADLVAAGRCLDLYRLASSSERTKMTRRYHLHEPSLRDALDARENFVLLLERAGLLQAGFEKHASSGSSHRSGDVRNAAGGGRSAPKCVFSRHGHNANVVAAVLVGALAPHVARVDSAAESGGAEPGAKKKAPPTLGELSVPKLAGALLALEDDAAKAAAAATANASSNSNGGGESGPKKRAARAVRYDRARLAPSSFLDPAALDASACHIAFFSRRWESARSRLQVEGCTVATPYALLLMYPGEISVSHEKREATIANWIRLPKTPARTAVLLRELRKKLAKTLAELFKSPPARHGFSPGAITTIDVIARLLSEEPTRAILGE